MAQDFLSAPATSVDIERAFSHGGGMVTKRRHALSAETIRANSLVASWTKEKLVPLAQVRAALASRQKRAKKQGTEGDVIDVESDSEHEGDGEDDAAVDAVAVATVDVIDVASRRQSTSSMSEDAQSQQVSHTPPSARQKRQEQRSALALARVPPAHDSEFMEEKNIEPPQNFGNLDDL
ncbi:hypothetical protein GGX14DRAFT_553717 [Mycena pura]|uniref:HAT C-terminal dimerisation domain-containing protein n=1 Tax=Mycena pura TaxID=153505 RepID=A0AAD6YV82_9AGAR|nr:hypothetical protein GGX14DRAFT_553717 [Mycena pura]